MNVRHELASTGLPTASGKVSNARPYASSAKFERQGPTEAARKIRSEPWSSMQRLKKTNRTTLRSVGRSALKKRLTEPTLVEMSGLATSRDLAGRCQGGYAAIRISQQLSVVRTIGRQQSSTCLEQVTEEWPSKHSHTLA
jgi:hypothetical protein